VHDRHHPLSEAFSSVALTAKTVLAPQDGYSGICLQLGLSRARTQLGSQLHLGADA
jgi:hypothetical protein